MRFNLSNWKPDLIGPLFIIAVSLIIIYTAQSQISVYRPLLSFEVLCASAFFSFRSNSKIIRLILLVVLIISLGLQLAELISIGFSLNLPDILHLLLSPSGLPLVLKSSLLLLALIFLAIFFFFNRLPRIKIRKTFFLVLFATPILFDIFLGANFLFQKDTVYFSNLVTSPIIKLIREDKILYKFKYWDNPPKSYLALRESVEKKKFVLFIEFESLGVPIDVSNNEILNKHIEASFPEYRLVNKFEEKFSGGTLSGELRTLCGIESFGNLLYNQNGYVNELSPCIPNVFNSRSAPFYSIAAHANYGSIYNRQKIYPAIGFNKSIFASDLPDSAIKDCGSVQFIACDDAILKKLKNDINKLSFEKLFVHVMTINSHFPYSGKLVVNLKNKNNFSLYIDIVNTTLLALKEFIFEIDTPPDVIIISGDHSPPFVSKEDRENFLLKSVPVYVFEKK